MRRSAALALLVALAALGCARLLPYRTPPGIERWQDPAPPRLSLREKADAYQGRIAALHRMPDGVIRYRVSEGQARDDHGDLADGPFFHGLYLASQSLRFAATGEPSARAEQLRALEGMALLMEVTGRPGLLARWVAREPPEGDARWRPSETRPGYWWRSDVSKDQVAGYACGLGVALALAPDAEIRARVAALAGPLAEHLRAHELRITDWDGEPTSYGDLRPRRLGIPLGLNALIALAAAKAGAAATGDARLLDALLEDGALAAARRAHWRAPGNTKRVNENMSYVALFALLRLEPEPGRAAALREAEARLWAGVAGERNAFFAFVHAAASGDSAARDEASAALREFPDRKLGLPVDLTRTHPDLPQRLWKSGKGEPRAERPLPLYLRPSGSNLWVSDPHQMAGSLKDRAAIEYAGIDYLLAYWLGRERGFVAPEE